MSPKEPKYFKGVYIICYHLYVDCNFFKKKHDTNELISKQK